MRIPKESFLVFPTPSTLYALLGGLADALDGGVVDGVALALFVRVGAGDGVYQGGVVGGVDVEEVPRSEIRCYQYLSSRVECNHVLSTPVFLLLV